MSFKPELRFAGSDVFQGNGEAFATYDEALKRVQQAYDRTITAENLRVVESTQPVTHTYVDDVLTPMALVPQAA